MVKLLVLLAMVIGAVVSGVTWWRDHPEAGRFRVDGTQIIGPDDEPFVPAGVNMLGPDAFFNPSGRTAEQAEVLAEVWNANTVRLNACLPEGCPYTDVQNTLNDDLDAIVDEYVDRGLVVMIALHQVEPGTWPDDATLERMAAWWHDLALEYADEPYVWFNLVNEPGSDEPASRRWVDVSRTLLSAVRSAGARNLVVVDGTSWGQEAGGDRGTDPTDSEDSAIITFGAELKGDDDAVAFSFHVYDQWGAEGADDAGRDARMTDYVRRVHDAGLALMIGETGSPESECCDGRSLATASAYRVAASTGIGVLAWHGQGIDGYQLVDVADEVSVPGRIELDGAGVPTNLTWHGQLLWDFLHR
jgi:hypothetical protein